MKLKKIVCVLMALMMFLFATTAYADWNLGSEDAAKLMDAIEGYVWNGMDAGLRVKEPYGILQGYAQRFKYNLIIPHTKE